MVNFRKRFNLDRPDRKSPLFLLPSNAALFLKGLHTRLARRLAGQSGDSAQLLGLGFALYWSAWFLFLRHRACPTAQATARR